MNTVTEYDAETGKVTTRKETEQEAAVRAEMEAYWEAMRPEREAAEAAAVKKAAVLDALATATGYTADELREALNA